VPEQVVVCVPRYLMFVEQAADDDLLQHFKSKAPWVRGPAARMSSSFTAPFNFKVALCLGHADRRSAHPGCAASPGNAAQNFFKCDCILGVRRPGCAGLRPACLQVSPPHLISKWHCAGGHADRRSAPPVRARRPRNAAQNFFKCDCILRVRSPGCAGLRPACLQVSPRHLISKWHCAGDMRTGGPRTQSAHAGRVTLLRTFSSAIAFQE
jgi:hypothetical protein